MRCAQAAIIAEVKTQSLEKSRAYAFLIDQINEGPTLSFRQAPWTAPSKFEMLTASATESMTDPLMVVEESMSYPPIKGLPHRPSSAQPQVAPLREPESEVGSALDVMEFLSQTASVQDRQGCECCDSNDFFDEYLQTVETGQKLCPRCIQAMRDDMCVAEPEAVTSI